MLISKSEPSEVLLTQKAAGHHLWDGSGAVKGIALPVLSEAQQNISFFSEMLSNWHLQDRFKISAHSSNRREGQLQVRLLSKTLSRARVHRAAFLIKSRRRQELTCHQRWSSFLHISKPLWEKSVQPSQFHIQEDYLVNLPQRSCTRARTEPSTSRSRSGTPSATATGTGTQTIAHRAVALQQLLSHRVTQLHLPVQRMLLVVRYQLHQTLKIGRGSENKMTTFLLNSEVLHLPLRSAKQVQVL